MHLAVVNVKVQAAVGREDAFGFYKARLEESQEVIKDVTVGFGADLDGGVALPGKAGAVTARLTSRSCSWVRACTLPVLNGGSI